MLKKYLLPTLNRLVQPFGYPVAGAYHVIVGSSIFWALAGSPRTVPAPLLLGWAFKALLIGTAATLAVMAINHLAGYGPKSE